LDYLHKNGYHLTEQISMQVVVLKNDNIDNNNNENENNKNNLIENISEITENKKQEVSSITVNFKHNKNTNLRYWSLSVLTLLAMPISRTLEHLFKDLKNENKLLSLIIVKQLSTYWMNKTLLTLLNEIEGMYIYVYTGICINIYIYVYNTIFSTQS
jgi:hypothetical protein